MYSEINRRTDNMTDKNPIVECLYVLKRTPSDTSKRAIASIIKSSIMDDISVMSNNHPGLFNVAKRYALYVTAVLPAGQETLLDYTLSQAMLEWHLRYINEGCEDAFKAYCQVIFDSLPLILDFTVMGNSTAKAGSSGLSLIWDCTHSSLSSWIKEHGITNVNIYTSKVKHGLTDRELSMLLACKVFDRSELKFWGLQPEYSHLLPMEEV